jgi:predicted Zn finger-like uncharacterized protein
MKNAMLVTCTNCEARLQVDENKLPSHSIKVRCPKCQNGIEVRPPSLEPDPNAITPPQDMAPPSSATSPFQLPIAAARFKPADIDTAADHREDDRMPSAELAKLLAAALRQAGPATKGLSDSHSWERRKALVCTNSEYRETIANSLVAMDFEVFVAANTAEALGRMREDKIAVLVLESDFDPVEQGFAFVTREIKLMRPPERRRLFLTFLTPTARTMDLHAAFLNNANLVVNQADVERLPEALEVSIRHFNELYRDFNRALELTAI